MAIQHVNIPDAQRHEAKGASTASANTVLKAVGDGSTEFVDPSTLGNFKIGSRLEAKSTTNQSPSATDTALQVVFGGAVSNTDAALAASGTVTINTAGLYQVKVDLQVGRSTTTATAKVVARVLVNDAAWDITKAVHLGTAGGVIPLSFDFFRVFSANDTIKVQIARDSTGENDGGLVTFNPVIAAWDDVPSAAVKVYRIAGGA